MPTPITAEVVDDLRRHFSDVALRLVWDIGEGSRVFQVIVDQSVQAYLKLAAISHRKRSGCNGSTADFPRPN